MDHFLTFIGVAFLLLIIAAIAFKMFIWSNTIGSSVVNPEKVASSKPKKKKSSTVSKQKSTNSKSKSSHKRMEIVENSDVISDTEVEPAKQAVKFDVSVPAPEEPVSILQEDVSPVVVEEDQTKKSKKAKETPEQKASRLERQKVAKATSKKSEDTNAASWNDELSPADLALLQQMQAAATSSTPHFDGWAVVEDKRKGKGKKTEGDDLASPEVLPSISVPAVVAKQPEAETPVSTPIPEVELYSEVITVEPRKVGLLIGPKGVTKIAIQEATGVNITMPRIDKPADGSPVATSPSTSPVSVTVEGPEAGVKRAVAALNELITKGYTTLLTPEDFVEGSVTVHPRYLPDIIGKSGANVKAIQAVTSVKITIPNTGGGKPLNGRGLPATKVKIGIAGLREQVSIARNLILEITRCYHTAVTHPGVVHKELDIDSKYFNFIIGAKGSEIKHIQANHKVSVHIPSEETHHTTVMVVGEPANVESAERHILRLVEKMDAQEAEKRLAVVQSGNGSGHNWQPPATQAADAAAAALGVVPSSGAAVVGGDRRGNRKTGSKPVAVVEPPTEEEDQSWMATYDRSQKAPMALSGLLPKGFGLSETSKVGEDSISGISSAVVEDDDDKGEGETTVMIGGVTEVSVAALAVPQSSAWKDIASKNATWE